MSIRSNFLKSELQKIYDNLNMSYEYVDFSRLENDTKFIKIFELLMEISDKSKTLKDIVRSNYLFYIINGNQILFRDRKKDGC